MEMNQNQLLTYSNDVIIKEGMIIHFKKKRKLKGIYVLKI